jgi:5,10-methylenetetrahydrofolate reductase
MASASGELTWLGFVLRDIGLTLSRPPTLHCDNLISLYLTINPVFHGRSKHIVVDYHYFREKVALGALVTQFISSSNQLADIFTKPLSREAFTTLSIKLGLTPRPTLRGSIRTNKEGTKNQELIA